MTEFIRHDPNQGENKGLEQWIRNDLNCLRRTLRRKTLIAGLASQQVRRVMEVGTRHDFSALLQLAKLTDDQTNPYFKPSNLWAVDPAIWDDSFLSFSPTYSNISLNRFMRKRVTVEAVADAVRRKEIEPFDLIFSKAVVVLAIPTGSIYQIRAELKKLIRVMKSCLNPQNPNAILMIATGWGDIIPLCKKDIEGLSLKIIGYDEDGSDQAKSWVETLQHSEIFPKSNEVILYQTVICKR